MNKKKKRVPIKNVDSVLVDVKKPGFNYQKHAKLTRVNLSRLPGRKPIAPNRYKKVAGWGILVGSFAFVVLLAFALFNLREVKAVVIARGGNLVDNFIASVDALKSFEPDAASPFLEQNVREISQLNEVLEKTSSRTLFSVLGSVVPVFKEAGNFLGQITELNLEFLKFSELVSDLQKNGFGYFQEDGETLIGRLREMKGVIGNITGEVGTIKNSVAALEFASPALGNANDIFSEEYLKHASDLRDIDSFLGGLIAMLDTEKESRILLIFHNPAEIRPAGGFIGSYGVITVQKGQMVDLEIQDIYWPDHPMNFDLKMIPPEPLQAVTTDWGARDGNWFFDFPTSAETVMNFLESSKIYSDSNIRFEGAIALNIRVMETILDVIGSVEVADYGLDITSENFLVEIQREVETGRDKKPGSNPKKILSVLTPLVLDKMNNLDEVERREVFEGFQNHFEKKDIMVFSRDSLLASFLRSAGVDGSVYSLPSSFWGSYAAVVNANIAGGKSDAFVEESVEMLVDIDSDGGIFTDLTVARTHNGDKEKDPWWRANNQNFIQVFTNLGSTLVSIKGNDVKKYLKPEYGEGYIKNAELEKIEGSKVFLAESNAWSMSAFGKTVFGSWWNIPAGESETLNLRYQTPANSHSQPSAGKRFRFIFERQSGVKNSLKVTFSAPLNFRWAESSSPVFVYEDDDPNSRVIVDLTLVK